MLRLFKQYYPIRNVFFVLTEGFALYASVLLSSALYLGNESFVLNSSLYLKTTLITFIYLICLYYNNLYDYKIIDSFSELGIRLFQALGAAAIFLAGIYYFFPVTIIGEGVVILSIAIVILLIASWRFIYFIMIKNGVFNERIILLGDGALISDIVSEITDKRDCGYTVEKIVPESKLHQYKSTENDKNSLCNLALNSNIKKIIVSLKERRGAFPAKELLKCRVAGIEIIEGNSFYEMLTGKLVVNQIKPAWLIFSEGFKKSFLQVYLKRAEDIIFSSLLLLVLSPIILITSILIKIESKGPLIFSQERLGRRKKPYMVHKFRSMSQDAEKESGPVWAQSDDPRVTRVGKFIRKWRIDEIPQLWNVLKGEMSLVGPRPERKYFIDQLEEIIPYYGERFSVKPGLTGWAQVCYGYGDSIDDAIEKLNYELFYIKNMSIFMDLVVVVRTVRTVIFGTGAR